MFIPEAGRRRFLFLKPVELLSMEPPPNPFELFIAMIEIFK
jgi:hypothetical protein